MALDSRLVLKLRVLHDSGCSIRETAQELSISRTTVARYLKDTKRDTKIRSAARKPNGKLSHANDAALTELFAKAKGNSAVIKVVLERNPEKYGLPSDFQISARSIRRYFQARHPELRTSQSLSGPVPFHNEPGLALQIDFVKAKFLFDGDAEPRNVYLFGAVYSWSRKTYIEVCKDMAQPSWLSALSRCICKLGIPKHVVCDNDHSLVLSRYSHNGKARFNPMFEWFCKPLGIRPIACRVRRPQSKGAVERFGGYMQKNGLVELGLSDTPIRTDADLQKGLNEWISKQADQRIFNDRFETEKPYTVEQLYAFERKYLGETEGLAGLISVGAWARQVGNSGRINLYGTVVSVGPSYANTTVVVSLRANGEYLITSTTAEIAVLKGIIPLENMSNFRFDDPPPVDEEKPANGADLFQSYRDLLKETAK